MNIRDCNHFNYFNGAEKSLVIIDSDGIIMEANEIWMTMCRENGFKKVQYGIGANYFNLLIEDSECEKAKTITSLKREEWAVYEEVYQFSSTENQSERYLVKILPFNLKENDFNGAILSHHPLGQQQISMMTAESVLENMNDGFYIVDLQFNLTYINEIGESLLRLQKEDVIGRNLWSVFPKLKSTGSFHEEYRRALYEQTEVQFESYYEPLSTWFNVKAVPLKNGGMAVYFQDIGVQKLAEQVMSAHESIDYLTGLPNRKGMTTILSALKEKEADFSLAILNLDNLSFINSLHNYQTGDQVIKRVGERVAEFTNEKVHVGRYEGDKFFLIREDSINESKKEFLDRLLSLFNKEIVIADFQSLYLKASVGTAAYPADAQNLDELLTYTETAMNMAKKMEVSAYTIFLPEMNRLRERRHKLEKGLMNDLSESGFYFALQPQIDGETGKIVGAEVLSRWNHPEFGELSPLEFIEIAEETGTIAALTRHLLKKVFSQMKDWHQQYGWNLKYAINMTPSLLSNRTFFNDFLNLMDQYHIHPDWVEIEVTEQAELTYSEIILENLLLCKTKGISIAIDDFGTGYSMISYLTKFPINKIKIDKFFIQKIGQDEKSDSVLKSLIYLIKSIKCEILAEGVERIHEIQFLIEHGCSIFQGYHFDKPIHVHQFEEKYLKNDHRFSIEDD